MVDLEKKNIIVFLVLPTPGDYAKISIRHILNFCTKKKVLYATIYFGVTGSLISVFFNKS